MYPAQHQLITFYTRNNEAKTNNASEWPAAILLCVVGGSVLRNIYIIADIGATFVAVLPIIHRAVCTVSSHQTGHGLCLLCRSRTKFQR